MGIEVTLQNALFAFFMETLTAVILQAKRSGHWDMGILGKIISRLDSVKIEFREFYMP